ncbi:hypothetical protein FKW77_000658 [Venturia effusa]|uniref:Uncharacterized protein n=1 Tax=Venturia effusa TaxID=50376 RepID=A0A517LRE7_9PEZI|nr:hypothetical protein FKW77_000658 [Venturia effusa]
MSREGTSTGQIICLEIRAEIGASVLGWVDHIMGRSRVAELKAEKNQLISQIENFNDQLSEANE